MGFVHTKNSSWPWYDEYDDDKHNDNDNDNDDDGDNAVWQWLIWWYDDDDNDSDDNGDDCYNLYL